MADKLSNTLSDHIAKLNGHIQSTTSDFTSWTFDVPKSAGAGVFMSFDEVWAFSYAPTNSIGATQLARAMRSQGDRNFSFSYNSSTLKITVTCTGTAWGGATVLV